MSHSERGQVIGSVAGGLVLAVGGALCGTLWEARRRLGKDKKHKKARSQATGVDGQRMSSTTPSPGPDCALLVCRPSC